jgi:hypothetical protein
VTALGRELGRTVKALAGSLLELSERLDRAGLECGRDDASRQYAQLAHDFRDLCAVVSRRLAAVGGQLCDDTPLRDPDPGDIDRASRPSLPPVEEP